MTALACAFVAVLFDDGSLGDGAAVEAAWALGGLDALAGSSVEDHAGHAGASGGAAARGGAGEVHVGAGGLAVGALVPHLVGWAQLVGHAVDLCAVPSSTLAYTFVAEFIACGSVGVVDSLIDTLAISNWDALEGFLIDSLAWETVASSDTLLGAVVWLNLSTHLSTASSALLVDLASWACQGAFSANSPVGYNFSSEGTFTGICRHGRALAVDFGFA